MITVSCSWIPASPLDFLLLFLENSHWYLKISISSLFNAAIVSQSGCTVIGQILRLQINLVLTFLTHAQSEEGKVSWISGARKNLELKKQAYPQILAFFSLYRNGNLWMATYDPLNFDGLEIWYLHINLCRGCYLVADKLAKCWRLSRYLSPQWQRWDLWLNFLIPSTYMFWLFLHISTCLC